ncbi:hypothetical protein V9T40_005490 [Parthenolecanium corni]|uniref:Myb-like domain-containing protein n=1 Tax=Parthenolecanium corni TaxID=536013 RepID=A0AAN9Y337_9HEMI
MNDSSLLVESLDKDWEDSSSEQLNAKEADPLLEAPRETQHSKDSIKEELIEEVDVFDEKPNELSDHDANSVTPVENNNGESFVLKISTETTDSDVNLPKSIDDEENSNYTVVESSVLSDSINLSVGETQRFIMQFNAGEVTLTPDVGNDSTVATSSDAIAQPTAATDDRDQIIDTPVINTTENKPPQISVKRKKIVKPVCQGERLVRKNATESNTKKKKFDKHESNVPSVYSYSEIKRHQERLTLKALQDDSSSDSDSKSSEDNFDPDLDVNLRIFEASDKNTEKNVIIGEIHCDMAAENENAVDVTSEKQSKNTVFKLSVNTDVQIDKESYARVSDISTMRISDESDERMNKIFINDDEGADDISDNEIDGLNSFYDDDLFSDNDSDLEILTSNSISRKRSSAPIMRKERPTDSDKRTMYDLIYDTVIPAPRSKVKSNEVKSKSEPKKKAIRKPKANSTKSTKKKGETSSPEKENGGETVPTRDEKTTAESKTPSNEKDPEELGGSCKDTAVTDSNEVKDEKTNDALPVPQLKVNADGEVIIDTDSLMIEQTGVAEARQAIANSEVVEETGLHYRSYSKKNNFKRQWSPHDTLKFYDVLSVVGTDFTLMATLFPGRTRNCIKRKYKREEKANRDLIMKALTCKQKFNIGLLEKELKLKEERVNLLKKNAKKVKQDEKASKKKDEPPKKAKSKTSNKRKSEKLIYFWIVAQCFCLDC